MMDNIWLTSALWIGLALLSSLISIRIALSVALVEIVVGAFGGNLIGMPLTPWINYLAGFGAILLTFLAGAEIDMVVVRRNLGASLGIGIFSFLLPYLGCMLAARYLLGWPWPQAQIAGISLSTTSVAVVYAVMVETGLNKTELGKIILAACFVTDLGTVLTLGLVFASFTIWLLAFAVAILATGIAAAFRMHRTHFSNDDLLQARFLLTGQIIELDDAHDHGMITTAEHDELRRLLLDALGSTLDRD